MRTMTFTLCSTKNKVRCVQQLTSTNNNYSNIFSFSLFENHLEIKKKLLSKQSVFNVYL